MNLKNPLALVIILLICICQSEASWECIVKFGCQNAYSRAKVAHPKIVNDCAKLSKAGTNSFSDSTFLKCLQTFGYEFSEIRNLINCQYTKCIANSNESQQQ